MDEILVGEARKLAESLTAESVDCIVTSPPYFSMRKYSDDGVGEIGRERTPEEYIENLTGTLLAVSRLLKPTGTMWINLGDTYKDAQLLGVPWRVAFALQSAGLRICSDVIWHKPNAMPSPVKIRPTTDHEYMFMLSKSPKYYYDVDAIREPHVTFSENSKMQGGRAHFGKNGSTPEQGKNGGSLNMHDGRWEQYFHPKGRNKRTVWSISLSKFRGAHFAVFPEKLVEPCILAGCPEGGVVLDPFMGAGTTAVVAQRLGRHYLGFELVEEFAQIARDRIAKAR